MGRKEDEATKEEEEEGEGRGEEESLQRVPSSLLAPSPVLFPPSWRSRP